MKSFKQFLLEDPQRGKTIVFYHRTGLGGQSNSLEHMRKDNIEDHVDSFLKDGFHIGSGDLYGRGVYGFYTENSMLNRHGGGYGNIVLKTKVNTDKILITVKEVAKKVYGRDITLEEQFKILKLKYPQERMITWESEYNRGDNVGLDIVKYYGKYKIIKLIKGLVYKGSQDFEAMVVYDPKLLTIMGYNSTLKNTTKLDGAWINVLGKNKNQIKTAVAARLSTDSSYERLFNETQFLENIKKYGVKNYDEMSEREKNKLESRLIEYVKRVENGINNLIEVGIKPSDDVISAAIGNGWYLPPKKIYDKLSSELKKKIEKNQIVAVKNDWGIIRYIIGGGIEPSKDVQLAAIEQDLRALEYIIDGGIEPSEAVQLAAVEKDFATFYTIMDAKIHPSESVQMAALKSDPANTIFLLTIGHVKISPNVQVEAVKDNLFAITRIGEIDNSAIKYVIDNYSKDEISEILTKRFFTLEEKQKLQAAFDKKYK